MENKSLVIKLNRNDVYRQLLAMCNDGEIYSLVTFLDGYKDSDLECLTVADRKAITEHPNTTAKDKIIGYIRLLPNNDDTRIIFVHKNRPEWYNYPVINPELWNSFINAVFEYFKDKTHFDAPQLPEDVANFLVEKGVMISVKDYYADMLKPFGYKPTEPAPTVSALVEAAKDGELQNIESGINKHIPTELEMSVLQKIYDTAENDRTLLERMLLAAPAELTRNLLPEYVKEKLTPAPTVELREI